MKFGYFDTRVDCHPQRSYDLLLDHLRDEVILCEQAGFDSAWLGEHHMGPEGMDTLPNPILLGADIACRTARIRIGQGANLVPYWHPIRLAEDIAMLDQMTKGRIEVALGRGVRSREGHVFHPKSDPANIEGNRELFEEGYEVLMKAWTQEFFSHRGPNYTFPAPGIKWNHPLSTKDPRWADGDTLTGLYLVPKPYQKPHPPLWVVSDSERTITFAAQKGIKVIMWQPTLKTLIYKFKRYAEIRSAAEGRPLKMAEGLALMRTTYLAPTMEEARRDAEAGILQVFKWTQNRRPLNNFLNPGEQLKPGQEITWDFLEPRNLLVGTPEYVAQKIRELKEVLNLDCLLLYTALPWIPHDKVMRSIDLFANKVMPQFQEVSTSAAS